MSLRIDIGAVGGPYRLTGTPLRSQRNFVKFHLMEDPRTPESWALRNRNTGWASAPLTIVFSNIGNFTEYCSTNLQIPGSSNGSWPPN